MANQFDDIRSDALDEASNEPRKRGKRGGKRGTKIYAPPPEVTPGMSKDERKSINEARSDRGAERRLRRDLGWHCLSCNTRVPHNDGFHFTDNDTFVCSPCLVKHKAERVKRKTRARSMIEGMVRNHLREVCSRERVFIVPELPLAIGDSSFQYDFGFPGIHLVIELDSFYYHHKPYRQQRDKLKTRVAESHGYVIVRVPYRSQNPRHAQHLCEMAVIERKRELIKGGMPEELL